MDDEVTFSKNNKATLFAKIKKAILQWLRLTDIPVVKVYHGYGNAEKIVVLGHVFSLSPLPRNRYRSGFGRNMFALLRSFLVVPVKYATVTTVWNGKIYTTNTAHDGFFRLECYVYSPVPPGIHEVVVNFLQANNVSGKGTGWIVVPHQDQLAFVSDIDDTFLVSHSANFVKKIYALFTKNAHTRKPFDGVVKHYQLLATAQVKSDGANPFFYVSNSEWNLYDFIKEFCRKNNLPEGVYLLKQLKPFTKILSTGSAKHNNKFMRIARIIESYPSHRFVLFGDDSQMDPVIYASIVDHFADRVAAVYLRHVYEKNSRNVKDLIEKMEAKGVPVCHFEHSREAIEHSYRIGLLVGDLLKPNQSA